MRTASAALLITLIAASTAEAQPTNEQLAARCAELGAIFDRYGCLLYTSEAADE